MEESLEETTKELKRQSLTQTSQEMELFKEECLLLFMKVWLSANFAISFKTSA